MINASLPMPLLYDTCLSHNKTAYFIQVYVAVMCCEIVYIQLCIPNIFLRKNQSQCPVCLYNILIS